MQTTQNITQQDLDKSLSYEAYREMIDKLLEQEKTTGENQSEALTDYTKMNVQRMKRWNKTAQLSDSLKTIIEKIEKPMKWVVLTEGWCGDAAQNIPILVKMAKANTNISIHFLLRDENLEIMDTYLTNGGRSIPKLVILDENLEELATWGPRPKVLQEMVLEHKKKPQEEYKDFVEKVHKWYAQNKNKEIQAEFEEILKNI